MIILFINNQKDYYKSMLRNEDQQQILEMLSQSHQTPSKYTDDQIGYLLQTKQQPIIKQKQSDSDHSIYSSDNNSMEFRDIPFSRQYIENSQGDREEEGEEEECGDGDFAEEEANVYGQVYREINQLSKPWSLDNIRQQYPLFLLSHPAYQIKNNRKELIIAYAGALLRQNILLIDVGYCQQEKVFKIAAGTDQGHIIIFEPNSPKPQTILDCFSKSCSITALKWSPNLQYLAFSSSNSELHILQFKQPIQIESHISFKLLKTPLDLCPTIKQKKLKNPIVQIYIINQNPCQLYVIDQQDQIFKITVKKHFISMRPYIQNLPIKFSNFIQLKFKDVIARNGQRGKLMGVVGLSYVTICVVQPIFEVIMVIDKDKHGIGIKKNGYPSISFRPEGSTLLLTWDKYLQIIQIQIVNFTPLTHKIQILKKHVLPDSTIHSGYLSNTLIFQLSRIGLKIYSQSKFPTQININSPQYFCKYQLENQEMLFKKVQFGGLPFGERIQEAVSNVVIQRNDLRFIRGLFCVSNRTLFYSMSTALFMVNFVTIMEYANLELQNNNWKNVLELLKDSYHSNIHILDEIHLPQIQSKIKQLTSRYINHLQIILNQDQDDNFIQNSKTSKKLLWDQQIQFIVHILLECNLDDYLLEHIFWKIVKIQKYNLVQNFVPFVLAKMMKKITPQFLEIMIQKVSNRDVVRRAVMGLDRVENQMDLPHRINSILVKNGMFLEIIEVNQKFGDYYTPFVLLIGQYCKLDMEKCEDNFSQNLAQRSHIGKLLSYCTYDTIFHLNTSRSPPTNEQHQLHSTLLPLLTDQIFPILLRQHPLGLFHSIIPQLYSSTSLQILNNLANKNLQSDLLLQIIINGLPYSQIMDKQCQNDYWLCVFQLIRKKVIKMKMFLGLKYLTINRKVSEKYVEEFVEECRNLVYGELLMLPKDIANKFFEELHEIKQYIALQIMVGKIVHKYLEVLDNMLVLPSYHNQKLYDYLQQIIPLLPQQSLNTLKTTLKANLKLLTSINQNNISDIISFYFIKDLPMFIDDLQQFPHQQLKLIQSILIHHNYDEKLIKIKVQYLQLLARMGDQEKLMKELERENYPLDQSLEICVRYGVGEGKAYLLVKSGAAGHIEEAIATYFQIIQQKFLKLASQHNLTQLGPTLMHYLSKCTQICIHLDLKSHSHHQNEWFIIISQLQSLKQNTSTYFKSQFSHTIRQIINNEAYPYYVQELLKQVDHQNIVNYLECMMGKFEVEVVTVIVGDMVQNYCYQRRIHLVAQETFIQTEMELRNKLMREVSEGFLTNCRCSHCNRVRNEEVLVHYSCGHQIHPSCGQDVKECLICAQDVNYVFEKKIDGLKKVQFYGKEHSKQEVGQRKLKIQKMREFDLIYN